jgi:hypothetical protein
MLKKIYHSIYSIKTIVNVLIALLIYIILKVFEIFELKGSFTLLYEIGYIFIIWTLFECLLKKDYFYIMFLYLMALPLQNWLIQTDNAIDIMISPFLINYSFVFLFVFLIKIIFNQRKIKKVKFQVLFSFWCIMLFSIISIINSKNVFIAINGITYGLIIPFMVFLIIINILKDKKDIILICEAIVLSLLFYNIFNFVLESTELLVVGFGSGRVRGIFGNPVFYAPLLVVSSLLSMYLIYYYKTTQVISKTLYFSTFCLSIFLLLITGSRGGIVVFFVALWLFFYQILKLNQKFLLLSIFITVLIWITFYIDVFKFLQASELITISRFLNQGLETERLNIWLLSYDFILAKELFFSGIGMGVLMLEEIGWTTPHNSFLYLSATIGVMGSILYHYILISSINIKSLLTRNINKNIPGIIVLSIFIYMNIVGYRILLYRYTGQYLSNFSLNVHIDVICLWIFVGVSYFVSNSRVLFKS